jgi:ribosome-binding factor A
LCFRALKSTVKKDTSLSTQRTYRVGELIQQEISAIILRGLRDPRVGFVTITSVDVTSDLRYAKVYFTVMGEDSDASETQQGLDSAVPFLRRELGKRLKLRHVPELVFKYDTSISYGNHIESLLKEAGMGENDEE